MLGYPLWLCLSVVAPCLAMGFTVLMIKRHRRRIDDFKAQGLPTGEALRAARMSWRLVVLGFILILLSIGLMLSAAGREDENILDAACAKHGMHGYGIPWGRNMCIDPNTGQLRAFEDVR